MNAVFNQNFLVGFLLSKGLPQQEQFLTGLLAAQLPANSPISVLLLKPIIDKRLEAERVRRALEAEVGAVRDAAGKEGAVALNPQPLPPERLTAIAEELQRFAAASRAAGAAGSITPDRSVPVAQAEEADYGTTGKRTEKGTGSKSNPVTQAQSGA